MHLESIFIPRPKIMYTIRMWIIKFGELFRKNLNRNVLEL